MDNTTVKSAKTTIDTSWQLVMLFTAGIGVSVLPDLAFASSSNAIEQVFCNVVALLNGATGKAIATVAVIAVGIGALLGKISWGMALIVALGVALVFGASSIVSALGGYSGSCGTYGTISGT